MAEDEKRAQQTSCSTKRALEAARLSRKLTETEASFNAAQGRLRHVEAQSTKSSIERARLVTTLDEANERHEHELTSQSMRFDSLQARAATLEKVVGEARELLLARAEQIREYERRNGDIAIERNALQERVSDLQAALIERESKYKEADQTRTTYVERNDDAGPRLHRQGSRAGARRGRQRRARRPRRRAGDSAGRREAGHRAEDRGTRRGAAPREARTRGGRKARWRPPARTSPG